MTEFLILWQFKTSSKTLSQILHQAPEWVFFARRSFTFNLMAENFLHPSQQDTT